MSSDSDVDDKDIFASEAEEEEGIVKPRGKGKAKAKAGPSKKSEKANKGERPIADSMVKGKGGRQEGGQQRNREATRFALAAVGT